MSRQPTARPRGRPQRSPSPDERETSAKRNTFPVEVDTHLDVHVAAALDANGGVLGMAAAAEAELLTTRVDEWQVLQVDRLYGGIIEPAPPS